MNTKLIHQLKTKGNFVCINIETTAGVLNILSLYGPNTNSPNFFLKVKEILLAEKADYHILLGDFNLVLDPKFLFFFHLISFICPFLTLCKYTRGARAANPPLGACTSAGTYGIWIYVHNNVVVHNIVLIVYDY